MGEGNRDAAYLYGTCTPDVPAYEFRDCAVGSASVRGNPNPGNTEIPVFRTSFSPKIGIRMKEQEIAGIDAPEIMDEYRRLTSYEWNLFEEGMLKVSVWPAGEETCFLLVFHHLLADGRAALGLAEELADCYAWGRIPELAEEKLISSAEDFPKESGMPLISRMLVNSANKIRAKTRECVSYREYYAAAGDFLKNDPVRHAVFRIDRKELNIIRNECRKHHVTVNDWLLARMMIEEHTEKVIMACDLRKQLACYNDGALGNYSTAFSVGIRTKERDPYILAGTLHKRVHRIMNHPRKLYLVLQCYANLDPAVLDAAWIPAGETIRAKPESSSEACSSDLMRQKDTALPISAAWKAAA